MEDRTKQNEQHGKCLEKGAEKTLIAIIICLGILLFASLICNVLVYLYFQQQKERRKEYYEDLDEEERRLTPKKLWKSIQENEVDVVLHPDTAHHQLSLNDDASQVRFIGSTQGPDRWYCVTGSNWFMKGSHYWEVEVGEKASWALGLATERINESRVIPENPENEFWIIRLRGGKKFEAVSSTVSALHGKPKKVGIYKTTKELSFYDAETRTFIHTFYIKYPGVLYPVFSPGSRDKGPLIIKKKKEKSNMD
ncbi:NF7O factor, partial [Polypterus senegalus]|nr:butyrophilin subfamily 1 member A1-like [Polypterus senegalus]XP_039603060.1 butyrophilin subfamily 1 member A1-like [Polypterus senegalus]MBN3294147.1 NF7O factor [Polypterus senegalus]